MDKTKIEKTASTLNKIGWTVFGCSIFGFFVHLVVCKYKQLHTNNYTSQFFVRGVFILFFCCFLGLMLTCPHSVCDLLAREKATSDESRKAYWRSKIFNIVLCFLVCLFGVVVFLFLLLKNLV